MCSLGSAASLPAWPPECRLGRPPSRLPYSLAWLIVTPRPIVTPRLSVSSTVCLPPPPCFPGRRSLPSTPTSWRRSRRRPRARSRACWGEIAVLLSVCNERRLGGPAWRCYVVGEARGWLAATSESCLLGVWGTLPGPCAPRTLQLHQGGCGVRRPHPRQAHKTCLQTDRSLAFKLTVPSLLPP